MCFQDVNLNGNEYKPGGRVSLSGPLPPVAAKAALQWI